MLRSLFTSATGMKAQQMYVDNVANNLANVNTTAFKRSRLDFQDLLYDTVVSPGSESVAGYQMPSGLQIGSGVRQIATAKIFKQGLPQATGRKYDIAISGNGFFQVLHPGRNQTVYTRDGSFRVNADGQLVTAEGFLLTPQVSIPTGTIEVSVGSDGTGTTSIEDGAFTKDDAHTIDFLVTVPARDGDKPGKKVVTYKVEYRW